MAILPIIEIPDPRLRLISEPVERIDDTVKTLVADMFETMYDAPGIGLAAIQVAEPRRILVIDLQEEEDAEGKPIRDPRVFINPEILSVSDETRVYNEGCLSIPEQYAEIERPATCRARWLDLDGTAHETEFDGLLATCLQHEMDHLNGIVFTDHLSRLKRDMVLKKLAKMRKTAA
ncbi:peptide deformylase [Sphingomonas japonica]|uniref:Peptide deformylase n=1 Tax=Sphingomonas japonica TaxID=511662 RepID=A0ABX0U3C0_9SPHN|nr:peptide deformylase [Sphingomonas japonica]NIJ25058.1 peptide deformylase [Sphingomonas japonica]